MPKSKKEKSTENKLTDKERISKGQVLCRIIIEVLGAPKEHVEEAIKLVVDKVKDAEDITLLSESTYAAEEKGKLFTTFSELEIWFNNIDALAQFIFNFTPSSVEIIQPSQLSIPAIVLSGFFNDFLLKMHDLGLQLKDTAAKTQLLQKNADALVRNFLNLALKEPKSSQDISALTGIPDDNVKAILANYEKANIVVKKGDNYVMKKVKE